MCVGPLPLPHLHSQPPAPRSMDGDRGVSSVLPSHATSCSFWSYSPRQLSTKSLFWYVNPQTSSKKEANSLSDWNPWNSDTKIHHPSLLHLSVPKCFSGSLGTRYNLTYSTRHSGQTIAASPQASDGFRLPPSSDLFQHQLPSPGTEQSTADPGLPSWSVWEGAHVWVRALSKKDTSAGKPAFSCQKMKTVCFHLLLHFSALNARKPRSQCIATVL